MELMILLPTPKIFPKYGDFITRHTITPIITIFIILPITILPHLTYRSVEKQALLPLTTHHRIENGTFNTLISPNGRIKV